MENAYPEHEQLFELVERILASCSLEPEDRERIFRVRARLKVIGAVTGCRQRLLVLNGSSPDGRIDRRATTRQDQGPIPALRVLADPL